VSALRKLLRASLAAGIALLVALTAAPARSEGVLLLSGRTATEGRWEAGLQTPDRQTLDIEALVRRARALAPQDDSPVLWFPGSGRVVRLDELPAEQRIGYACLALDNEQFAPGQVLFRPVRDPLEPALWVAAEPGRVLWWPEPPQPADCGSAITLLAAEPESLDFGGVVVGQSARLRLRLINQAETALTIGRLDVDEGDFAIAADACSALTLVAEADCLVEIDFSPAAPGPRSSMLVVPHGAGRTRQVPLNGLGQAAPLPDAIFASGFE
jgi:hypothetical protein